MNRYKLLVMMLWLGVLLSSFPTLVLADDVEEIAADLRPASGYLVMPINGEFLVDLDASQGLRAGDLLSVVEPGEKIVHPVTQEVIGSLDSVKAILKVTRVKTGYSYARRISGEAKLDKGERVRRFAGLTAALYSSQMAGEKLYDRLRAALPELEWQGRFPAPADGQDKSVDLRFMLEGRMLRLLDSQGEQLRAYSVASAESGPSVVPSRASSVPAVNPPVVSSVAAMPSAPAAVVFPSQPAGVDFGPLRNLGKFPDRVLMAAFTGSGESLLVATVDASRLSVYAVADQLQQLGTTTIGDGLAKPLAVSWWRPVPGGPLYLAVTAAVEIEKNFGNIKETRLKGAIYAWDGRQLVPTVERVPYFLRTFDRDGDGQPETLLGQEFDPAQVYGRIFALSLAGRDLQRSAPSFDLPRRFFLPGSAVGDLDGDSQPELMTIYNKTLTIYSGAKKVYESSGNMGGSLASLTYDVNPGVVDTISDTVSLEVPPVVRDIDGDGIAELLAVATDTPVVSAPGIGPGVDRSWVAVIKYRNGMYDKGRLTFSRENPLQGLWEDAGRVFLVESQTTSVLSKEGTSSLLVYPLAPVSR
ncbi:MAG TPA: hypothetical protein VJ995_08285 [Geothermobacteraceae bacterium]|nr:hypothetical protein [Geothermobacteraceae bacterium]